MIAPDLYYDQTVDEEIRDIIKKYYSKKLNRDSLFKWILITVIVVLCIALAYFAIMCIAIALILRLIFKKNSPNIASAFQSIGEALAYIICIWMGFYWTRRKSNIWWFICWLVAAVLIIVIYIFALTA